MIKTAGCPELCFQGSPILTFHFSVYLLFVLLLSLPAVRSLVLPMPAYISRSLPNCLSGCHCHNNFSFHYKKNKLSVKPIKRKIISITIIYKITHLQRNVNIWKLKRCAMSQKMRFLQHQKMYDFMKKRYD